MSNAHLSPKRWFWKRLTQELFALSFAAWVILLFLELVKAGLVSNYLSLTHTGFIVFLLGFLLLAQQPSVNLQTSLSVSANNQIILSIVSLIIGVSIFFITDLSPTLTLALIFVTVSSLWAGSYLLTEE